MKVDAHGYVITRRTAILPAETDAYAEIQAAIDNTSRVVVIGTGNSTYTVSKPLLLKAQKTYIFEGEIKIADSIETLLTVDFVKGNNAYTVASVTGFAVGMYVCVTDDLQYQQYATYRGTCGKITDITGLVITIDNINMYNYSVAANARLATMQNVIICQDLTNVKIMGSGSINANKAGQRAYHPTYGTVTPSETVQEFQIAGNGITVYDCTNFTWEDLTFKNGRIHNVAITGRGSGNYKNTNVVLTNVTAIDGHEKNILLRFITGFTGTNIVCNDAAWEDNIIFYSGCVNCTVNGFTGVNAKRANFLWNSASNDNLVASDIDVRGIGTGLLVSSKNAVFNDVYSESIVTFNAGYPCSNIEINGLTIKNVTSTNIILLTGGVSDIRINDLLMEGCNGKGITANNVVGGSYPNDVRFVGGEIKNHTGDKTSILGTSDVTFTDVVGIP